MVAARISIALKKRHATCSAIYEQKVAVRLQINLEPGCMQSLCETPLMFRLNKQLPATL